MIEAQLAAIIEEYKVPTHIIKHMKKVSAVCLFLGRKLQEADEKIDLIFLRQAALLHDFVKLADFSELDLKYFEENPTPEQIKIWQKIIKDWHHLKHCYAAYEILTQKREERLGLIIKKHRFSSLIDTDINERPTTWEEKILYYADKRVRHDQIVSIQERLLDGRNRYFPSGAVPEEDTEIEKVLYKLEAEILDKAGLKPEDITEKSVEPFLEA